MALSIDQVQRQAQSTSFAFTPAEPYQARPMGSGVAGASGIVGGHVTGGDKSGNTFNPAPQIGQFLDGLLKPYVQERAFDQMIDGATQQMYAMAAGELYHDDSVLTKIFGSHAQDGAAAYAAQERVSQFQQKWMEDQPDLIKMSPADVSRELASRFKGAMTGIPEADQIIGPAIMQSMPALTQATAKAAFAYNQEQGVIRGQSALVAAGTAFNSIASKYMAVPQADPAIQVGLQNAAKSYIDTLMTPIEGQTEQSRKKMLLGSLNSIAQQGSGYAITYAIKAGALNGLDEEDRVKLNDKIRQRAKVAAAEAVVSNQDIFMLKAQYDQKKFFNEYTNPAEELAAQQSINAAVKNATGFDYDYFQPQDTIDAGEAYWRAAKAEADKQQNYAEQRRLADLQHQYRLAEEKAKEQAKASAAILAFNSSNPAIAGAVGNVQQEEREAVLTKAFQSNDFVGLNRSFVSGWGGTGTAHGVADAIANQISSAALAGDSKTFLPLVSKFNDMSKVNPAMAKAYFGNYYPMMLNYNKLMAQPGMDPQVALASSFDDTQYVVTGAEANRAAKAATKYVSSLQPTFGTSLNTSGTKAWANAMANELAVDGKAGLADLGVESQASAVYGKIKANNSVEQVGPLAWRQKAGTVPIWQAARLPQDKSDAIVLATLDKRLKERGFAAGIHGDEYQIHRLNSAAGDSLYVVPVGDTGPDISKAVMLPIRDIAQRGVDLKKAAIAEQARKQALSSDAIAAVKAGLNPYRTVATDKTGADRVARINREVKLADPTNPQKLWPAGKPRIVTGKEPWAN